MQQTKDRLPIALGGTGIVGGDLAESSELRVIDATPNPVGRRPVTAKSLDEVELLERIRWFRQEYQQELHLGISPDAYPFRPPPK